MEAEETYKQRKQKDLDRTGKSGPLKLSNETVNCIVLSIIADLSIQQFRTSDDDEKYCNKIYAATTFK